MPLDHLFFSFGSPSPVFYTITMCYTENICRFYSLLLTPNYNWEQIYLLICRYDNHICNHIRLFELYFYTPKHRMYFHRWNMCAIYFFCSQRSMYYEYGHDIHWCSPFEQIYEFRLAVRGTKRKVFSYFIWKWEVSEVIYAADMCLIFKLYKTIEANAFLWAMLLVHAALLMQWRRDSYNGKNIWKSITNLIPFKWNFIGYSSKLFHFTLCLARFNGFSVEILLNRFSIYFHFFLCTWRNRRTL